jgi:hypothetical protein
MTASEVSKLVAVLIASFPHAKVNAGTSQAYEAMLADLDYETANGAVAALVATSRYLPTIAEIREAALTATQGPKRSGVDAWGEVRAAVGRYGMNRTPVFEDSVTAHVMSRLGWREFCQSDSSEMPSWRARFVELYDKTATDERRDALIRSLPAVRRMNELRAAESARPKTVGELVERVVSAREDLDS